MGKLGINKKSITPHLSDLDCVVVLARKLGFNDLDLEPMEPGYVLRMRKDDGTHHSFRGKLAKVLEDAYQWCMKEIEDEPV